MHSGPEGEAGLPDPGRRSGFCKSEQGSPILQAELKHWHPSWLLSSGLNPESLLI